MKRLFISAALAASILFVTSCKESTDKKVLTKVVSFKKEGELSIKKANSDSIIVKLDIEIADDEYQIQTGLMYRKTMQMDRGMLFLFKYERPLTFYMKNTEIALDIIYLSSTKKVVSISKNAQPFDQTTLSSTGPARYVLEVNAGLTDTWDLKPGDWVEWTRQDK